MAEQNPPYSQKVYGIMKELYGDKFTHTQESFDRKLNSDYGYTTKIYGIMKQAYGDKFTHTTQSFADKLKKKEPTTTGSGQPAKPSAPSSGQTAFDAWNPAFKKAEPETEVEVQRESRFAPKQLDGAYDTWRKSITKEAKDYGLQIGYEKAPEEDEVSAIRKAASDQLGKKSYTPEEQQQIQEIEDKIKKGEEVEMLKPEMGVGTGWRLGEFSLNNSPDDVSNFYQKASALGLDEESSSILDLTNKKAEGSFYGESTIASRSYAEKAANLWFDLVSEKDPSKASYLREKYNKIKGTPENKRSSDDEKFLRDTEGRAIELHAAGKSFRLNRVTERINELNGVAVTDQQKTELDNLFEEYGKLDNSLMGMEKADRLNRMQYGYISRVEAAEDEWKQDRYNKLSQGDGKLSQFFQSALGAMARGGIGIGQVPKVFGDLIGDKDYDYWDETYDSLEGTKRGISSFYNDLPQGKKSSDLPFTARLALVGGNAVGSASLFIGGGLLGGASKVGQTAATFGTAFLTSEADYYQEALDAGMDSQSAALFGTYLATQSAVLESIIPDVKYLKTPEFRRSVRNSVMKRFNSGMPLKEAMKFGYKDVLKTFGESGLSYLKTGTKEAFIEELPTQLAEDLSKTAANAAGQKKYFNNTFDPESYVDAILGSFVAGPGMNLLSRPETKSPVQEEVIREIAERKDKLLKKGTASDRAAEPDNKKEIEDTAEILDGMKAHSGWSSMSREEQNHALATAQQIEVMKKEQERMKELRIPDERKDAEIKKLEDEVNEMFSMQMEQDKQKAKDAKLKAIEDEFNKSMEGEEFPVQEDERDQEIVELQKQREEKGVNELDTFLGDMKPMVPFAVERTEQGLPVAQSVKQAASNYLYKKYKELTEMKSNPNRMMTRGQIASVQKQLEQDIRTLEGTAETKTEARDQENIQGISSQVREGQEPVAAQPIEGPGAETTEAGGVLQAPGQEEVTAEVTPEVTPEPTVKPSRRDRLAKLFETSDGEEAVPLMEQAIAETGIKVEVKDDADYNEDDRIKSGQGRGSEGMFIADDGTIVLNRDKIKGEWGKTIVFHEGIHPVVNIIRNTDPKRYKAIVDGLKAEAARNNDVAKVADEVAASEDYQQRGAATIEDETLVETMARVATGDVDIDTFEPTFREKFIEFMNDLAKMLGLKRIAVNSPRVEVKRLADQINKMLNEGGKISDVVGKKNVGKFQNTISDGQFSIDARIADKGVQVPRSEKLPLKIVASKEESVMRRINELLDKYPNALTDKEQWKELMSRVFPVTVDGEVFIPAFPEGLARMAGNVQETLKEVNKVSDEQRKLASEGLKGTKEIGELYKQGKMDEVDTGLYFLWNIMSIGISPYPQESGFLQAVNGGIDKYIKLAADGKFTKSTLEEYLNWVDGVLPKGTPGAGSKSNLNSFGKSFLSKAAEEIESGEFEGKTKLQALHEILSDRKTPTNELRRKWQANMSSMQFNNKIFDFILLTTGRSDLFVTDRVRVDHFWDGNNFKKKRGLKDSTSLYDGSDLTYGASTGAGFSKILSDVPGLVFNELANRTMTPIVEEAYNQIGVKEYPEVGRFHWETWVAASSQEVSHGSIDAIVQRKEKGEIQDAGIRQGKYGAWDFNFAYKKRAGKNFVYEFVDNDGNTYVFDKISDIQDEIEKQKKKTYETNNRFLLPDAKGNISRPTKGLSSAWYDTELVDTKKYFEFLRSKAKEVIPAPDVVEDQGVVIETPKSEKTPKKGQASKGIKRGSNLVKETYYESGLTEDKNDYVFFHVSSAPESSIRKGIDSTKYTSLRTAREEKGLQYGVASYYTRPEDGERMVGGEKYAVRVPKAKVYPIDSDPLGYGEKAEAKVPQGTPFRGEAVKREIADMAKKNGYEMIVGEWSYSRTGKPAGELPEFRADALVPLKPTKEKPESFTSNAEKGMERIPFPGQQSEEAKQELENLASEVRDIMSAKKKFSSKEYQLADSVYMNGQVTENKDEDNEFKRDITPEEYDMMTKVLPKSMQAEAARVRGLLFGKKGQASKGIPRGVKQFSDNVSETVDRIKSATSEDGATLNLDGTTYEDGGLVVPAGSLNVAQDDVSAEGLFEFLKDNEENVSSDIFKIGLYKFPDRPEVSYDLNIVIPREYRDVALKFGELTGQESLFDLDTFENIKTGSDGKNPRKFTAQELAEIAKDLSEGRLPKIVSEEAVGYRGLPGEYVEDYNGIQYFAENEKYAGVFGKNIVKANISKNKVLDLAKWNKKLKDAGIPDNGMGQPFLTIDQSMFDENRNFTTKGREGTFGKMKRAIGLDEFNKFKEEFDNADVIYGEDAGNVGEKVYAVRNPKAISVGKKGQPSMVKRTPINWEKSPEGKGDPSISSRNPVVTAAAQSLKDGKITNEEYRATISENSPILPITRFFEPATIEEIKRAFEVATKKETDADKIDTPVKEGTEVALRLDIPSYKFNNTWVVSVHDGRTKKGPVISYTNVAKIKDVEFSIEPKAALNIAAGIQKTTIGRMYGTWESIPGANMAEQGESAKKMVESIVNDPSYVQVGMNPFRHSYFYDRSSDIGRPIMSAEEVVQIGGLVYAKNPVYGNWTDEAFEVKGMLDSSGKTVQFSGDIKRTPAQTQKLMEDALDAVEGAIADGVDADTAVADSVTSQDWYGQLTPRQKQQLDEIINDEFGVTAKAPVAKPTGIKATIANIIDNYYKGDRQSKLDNKQILESDPKLKYIYDNIAKINKQLQEAGVITDKTDGCP
jgi:hypothetical protein